MRIHATTRTITASRARSGRKRSTKPGAQHLVANIVGSMTNPDDGDDDPRPIQERMLKHWYKVHPDFGAAVARGIGLEDVKVAAE